MDKINCIAVMGLPGSGKSYFAEALAKKLKAVYLSSDIIRMEILEDREYSNTEKQRVYKEMWHRAGISFKEGKHVILDATFYTEDIRRPFYTLASERVRLIWIEIQANEALILARISKQRKYSEAGPEVYRKIQQAFEPLRSEHLILESTNDNLESMLNRAITYIHST